MRSNRGPLDGAAQNGHTETVRRLLEAGATVNHQSKVFLIGELNMDKCL